MRARTAGIAAGIVAVTTMVAWASLAGAQSQPAASNQVPTFKVDPAWPKVPKQWVLGLVSGVGVDSKDHIWVLHRPRTVNPEDKGKAAPPVLEFDVDGNFIQAWGGPGQGYEWPETEHGIAFDSKDNAWIAGSGRTDGQLLKFTRDGKFLLQIGHSGQSNGNGDRENVRGAADITYYAKTNEIFVADGYNNRRIIVFDADTGAFKRMWGAFGNVPTDPPPPPAGSSAATVCRRRTLPPRRRRRPIQSRALGPDLERRPALRGRPCQQAGPDLHARRQVRQAGVHQPDEAGAEHRDADGIRSTGQQARRRARQCRHDRLAHRVLARQGAALPLRRRSHPASRSRSSTASRSRSSGMRATAWGLRRARSTSSMTSRRTPRATCIRRK